MNDCYECALQRMIKIRAYELYEWRQEFGIGGNAYTDWLDAEVEMLDKFAQDVVDKASKDIQQKNHNNRNGKGKTP